MFVHGPITLLLVPLLVNYSIFYEVGKTTRSYDTFYDFKIEVMITTNFSELCATGVTVSTLNHITFCTASGTWFHQN